MSIRTKRVLVAVSIMTGAMLLWWLAESESSPLRWYFLHHPLVGNLLALLSLPAVVVGAMFSGNVHQPNEAIAYVAMALEWFLLGYVAGRLIFRSASGPAANDSRTS